MKTAFENHRFGIVTQSVWAIALPTMLTNVATALFGLADMWTIGKLGDASAQGGVELGAKGMMALLNIFNFLRTSTVALTAQNVGRGDRRGQAETLARALAVAFATGAVLLLTMDAIIPFVPGLLGATGSVQDSAISYMSIRYWAAPLWLSDCVLVGWLIGQRQVRAVLVVEVSSNLVHIALDIMLVLVANWGVRGIATATLASEFLKFVLLTIIVMRQPAARASLTAAKRRATWQLASLIRLFALNRDLFGRTLLLNSVLLVFARIGAQQGAVTLAANAILFQLFMLASLLLDGFESASQVLCGEALGSGDRVRFVASVRVTLFWAAFAAIILSGAYLFGAQQLAGQFSADTHVVTETAVYAPWVIVLPLLGFASFALDGVFVGAGWTRAMLATMAIAMGAFAILLWAARPWGNNGMWMAFDLFFVVRAAGQLAFLPRLIRRSFSAA